MPKDTYDIQELVTQSGVPRRTIYFYVQQGVLPPPEGAGLAAHYTEHHLLRLRLIPLLRQEGLRLDEIRARFSQLSEAEMRAMISTSPPAAAHTAARSVRETADEPFAPPIPPAPLAAPAGWGQQRYSHYTLPAGISLVAPENLSAADRQRLNQLLQAARQIFSGGIYVSAAPNPGDNPEDASGDHGANNRHV